MLTMIVISILCCVSLCKDGEGVLMQVARSILCCVCVCVCLGLRYILLGHLDLADLVQQGLL
jgi:hypothetical protein